MKIFRTPASYIGKTLKFSVLILFTGCLLASCKKITNEEPQLRSAVNVVNATVGLNPIGFFINDSKVLGPPLEYTQESGYFITYPRASDFDAIEGSASNYFLETNVTFKPNTYHTIFIAGERSSITSLFTEDDLSTPAAGKAKVRFVHLSPDGGSLILAIKNGAELFSGQDYKTASEFKTIDPGNYDLQLKTPSGAIILEQNVTITAGGIYTAWVKGIQAGSASSPIGLQFGAIN